MQNIINKIKSENGNRITLLLNAIIVSFAFLAKWEVIPESSSTNFIADFVNRFAIGFTLSSNNNSDIFIFIGIVLLIRMVRRYDEKIHRCTLITSAIFAFVYLCSISFMNYESMIMIDRDLFQFIYSLLLWCGATITIYNLIRICSHIIRNNGIIEIETKQSKCSISQKKLFVVSFCAIGLCWSFWLICIYPGTCNIDAVYQLIQYFSGDFSLWSTHHPPFSTLIMGSLVRVGQIVFHSSNFGFFLYLVLQTVLGALILAYGVITLKKHFCINDKFLIGIIVFFSLVPFWGVYAALYEKSLLYSEFVILLTIQIIPVIKEKNISMRMTFALFLSCILASLLRNNGIYIVVPTLVALIIYLKDVNKKRMIVVLTATILVFYCVNHVIYPGLGIQKGSIKEALSLPFQQTAKYVKYYSDDVTENEKEAIDGVLAYDSLGQLYDRHVSNPVKDTYKGDNSKLGAYLKVWFTMFFKHPDIYFSAFMDNSYGYLAPINQSIEATTDFDYELAGLQPFGLTKQAFEGGVELTNAIRTLSLNQPLIKYLCMPGLYSWILILGIIILWRRKKYSVLIAFIPSVISLLVCFASPLSTSMRYSHSIVASIPFLIGVTVYYYKTSMNE